ncbi:hypothetical protein Taro_032807 [Colocasia esculenta]|uniref:Exostosin GT47 domain-containing protein n=1 Tax=Colocasia esculenta TaxID=4460 RepID=A0A843VS96_COLES|nr:hypothetical protein [Colocasia esculenta]
MTGRRLSIVERSIGGSGGGTRVGRRFWCILPVACVFWFTFFAFYRQSYIPTATTTIATTIIITTTTNITNATASAICTATDDTVTTTTSTNKTKTTTKTKTTDDESSNKHGVAAAAVARIRPPRATRPPPPDPCAGRYVYVHDLPRRFNTDLLRDCRTLSSWTNMCKFTSNAGLGPALGKSGGVFSGSGCWYGTNQFALEVIFHNRMKQYACLTKNSSLASAVFIPFFAGLDVARYLWGNSATARDAASLDLVRWLRSRPEWGVMGGRDHFLVAGRIAWDFRRLTESDSGWGNKLLVLPETKNMSVLVLESSPWHSNDFAIPYPTYFHPSKDGEVVSWQKRMRRTKRPWLFSFAGAPRPNQTDSIRGRIIEQCRGSRRCRLMDCTGSKECYAPARVMRAFESSTFCLQPPGDSYTRRSAFDAMVAGCVPVFFHPGSAYVQYLWHLPRDYRSYSVLIPEEEVREGKVSIEERLGRIPEAEVRAMREEVIRMIPRLVYANPRARGATTVKDAFEVAVEGVIGRVDRLRKEMKSGEVPAAPHTEDVEHDNWKLELVGNRGPHEWDRFFSNLSATLRP